MDDSWGYAGIAIACAFSPTPGQGCPTAAARLQGCQAPRPDSSAAWLPLLVGRKAQNCFYWDDGC